jgi:hypothetical protein
VPVHVSYMYFRCESMAACPLAVPIQTASVGDTGRRLDIHTAEDLLDSSFDPATNCQ